ncbi:MAG TPA: hypothetical protein PL143_00295 [Rhodocyclaceae bacterium]|nr:hypothetical protein [Rhodocyclaceae bacterium]
MKRDRIPADADTLHLQTLVDVGGWARVEPVLRASMCARVRLSSENGIVVQRDEFSDMPGLMCAFVRLSADAPKPVRFVAEGRFRIVACAAGGWLLESADPQCDSWWLPRQPVVRTFDGHGRVLLEQEAELTAFGAGADAVAVSFVVPAGFALTAAIWRIAPSARAICKELQTLLGIEHTRSYLWSSRATIGTPGELYAHLIDGRVYQSVRAYPRNWKFCSDLDAYEIFLRFTGLERATGKRLYGLLRRQLVLSTLARQAADGGWYHGEWSDMNECHLRFMAGALLLLENALDEWPDETVRAALARGIAFAAAQTDQTELGLWFLHDSLEQSATAMDEMHRQNRSLVRHFGAWKPSRLLGKSPTNKMILNTHVDMLVVLQRYRQLTGDPSYDETIASALAATRSLLALHPSPWLYGVVGRALNLTMLPSPDAKRLALPLRVLRRLASRHLLPNLWRLKHRWPRIVMPGGFIDRHLGPLQFSPNYHCVNVLDLVRLWRHFPDEQLEDVVAGGIEFAMGRDHATLRWWQETQSRRFAIGVLGEALVHLCALRPEAAYRHHLVQVLLAGVDLQLGLPPSLHGGNAEIAAADRQTGCPSAHDRQLWVVNLGTREHTELLVVNPAQQALELAWETPPPPHLCWTAYTRQAAGAPSDGTSVPARGYLRGIAPAAGDNQSDTTERST